MEENFLLNEQNLPPSSNRFSKINFCLKVLLKKLNNFLEIKYKLSNWEWGVGNGGK